MIRFFNFFWLSLLFTFCSCKQKGYEQNQIVIDIYNELQDCEEHNLHYTVAEVKDRTYDSLKGKIILPVLDYDHLRGDVSITGGGVYRGTQIPDLVGQYIFADFASGRVWAATTDDLSNVTVSELIDSNLAISFFGVNDEKELFLCAFDGRIYQLESVVSPN